MPVLEKEEIHLAIVDIMMPRMDGITMTIKLREKHDFPVIMLSAKSEEVDKIMGLNIGADDYVTKPPRMDGITMTIKLREKHDFPVIMLSAKSEEVDKIMGLNIGADDYVTKPFTPMELMARVNSQMRRYRKFMEKLQAKESERTDTIYTIGGLEVNENTFEVRVDDTPVKMTPMEFKILLLLIKNPGRVFSADEIYERVWNERAINTETVMVHVRNIREKIEINPKEPKYLKVVWGVGYKIEKLS